MKMDSIKYLKRIAELLERGASLGRGYEMMCDEYFPSSDKTPEERAEDRAKEEKEQDDFYNHQEWLERFISDLEKFLDHSVDFSYNCMQRAYWDKDEEEE